MRRRVSRATALALFGQVYGYPATDVWLTADEFDPGGRPTGVTAAR
jgi:hypothetical protein